MNREKYRSDIDGLRAIAILAVVCFHFFPGRFWGGFIGVDVFFVISGFLISGLIWKNLENGTFSYADFYSRRIKRIIPALVLVLFVTLSLGWYVLFPFEYSQLGKHTLGGASFISNFILWKETGYFDAQALTKPLHHLWSLSVEEQFYFLWPLLLGLVWRRRFSFFWVCSVIAVLSFGFNILNIENHPNAVFYSPISRFFELMIGGMLAYLMSVGSVQTFMSSNWRSMLGFLFLGIGMVFIDDSKSYPGWWALLPCIGTFLIISADTDAWLNHYILSNRLLVWVGLISYPLYLWHWVVLSYAYIIYGEPSRMERVVLIVVSMILASLTYVFVEKPIRAMRQNIVPQLAVAVFSVFSCGAVVYSNLSYPRQHSKVLVELASVLDDWEFPGNLKKRYVAGRTLFETDVSGSAVLFMGDSHMQQYAPRIMELTKTKKITKKAIYYTGTYGGLPERRADDLFQRKQEHQDGFISDLVGNKEVGSVVLAGFWNQIIDESSLLSRADRELILSKLEKFIGSIVGFRKVFLVLDNPNSLEFSPQHFYSGGRLNSMRLLGTMKPTLSYGLQQDELRQRMIRLAERTGATVIDPIPSLCPNGDCRTTLEDGTPIYRDAHHLRASYVKKYADYIDAVMK